MHRRCFSLFGLLLVSFCALAHDIVAVVRWIERRASDEFVKRLLAAVGPAGK